MSSIKGFFKLKRRQFRIALVRCLDIFFPKSPDKYIFVAKAKYGIRCNLRKVAEYYAEQKHLVYVFFEGEVSNEQKVALIQQNIILLNRFNAVALFHILTSGKLFLSHSIRDAYISHKRKSRTVVNLWHGVPIKAIEMAMPHVSPSRKALITKNSELYDYLICSSCIDRLAMASCFGLAPTKVLNTGLPRYDYITNSDKLPLDLELAQLRLKEVLNGKKLVLYAPTFRENLGATFQGALLRDLKLLKQFCDDHQLIFAVRNHISDPVNIDLSESGILLLNDKFISETNLLLKHVHCLITDYSSIWIDYLLLQKPIVGYSLDFHSYKSEDRGFLYDFESVFPSKLHGDIASVINELFSIVNTGQWTARYDRQLEMFHSNINLKSTYTSTVANRLKCNE
ncbi:CDP-glycerol glycerophosphotransferase family protein [Catenovulum sediminis]|uniref:CDP-glycerol glycerophosphotransferase family protein n=1 Tax=Catenovulum sediminis TaxID=1740262 RepID=UPI00117D0AA8|nr:CDP-glycerol glycerophosphotransferase family protein [Catenovulum sediminis]